MYHNDLLVKSDSQLNQRNHKTGIFFVEMRITSKDMEPKSVAIPNVE
jgi:hypothetical protein